MKEEVTVDGKLLLECEHKSRRRKPHDCPYQSDVNDNKEIFCTCCTACMNQCADDI